MVTGIFWLSLLLLIYIYIGYPVAIRVLAACRPRPVIRDDSHKPSVTIVIAAYNEAAEIGATLTNKLRQDYPSDLLEILVVSDESDDGTDDIVRQIAKTSRCPIRLIRQMPRQGKTAGLNVLIAQARGEIILFSDANSQWNEFAVARLVSNFADPQVGYVTGKMVYVNDDGSLVGDGCNAYMRYENWLRLSESAVNSVVGVDGGIDGIRKSLFQPLRADQLPDFVQPLKVVEQGYRVVYEPRAVLQEKTNQDSKSEFSMRVRVGLRALWALKDMGHLMGSNHPGTFAWQLISHKLLRYLAFIPLLTLTMVTPPLALNGRIYLFWMLGLTVVYSLAWVGRKKDENGKKMPVFCSIPYYFIILNLACFYALLAFVRGEKKIVWDPRKG